ncbi:MAG: hypothetical protein L0Z62_03520 [Gemmataceae bacterium]|nr:hypothetical protein [Gemmataceae bacterium]
MTDVQSMPRAAPAAPAAVEFRSTQTDSFVELLHRLGASLLVSTYQANKVPGGMFADPEQRLRFQDEAEAVARLQHPNIVQIFEVGEDASGVSLDLRLGRDGFTRPITTGQPILDLFG